MSRASDVSGLPGYSDGVRSMYRDQGKTGGGGSGKTTKVQAENNRRGELLHKLQEGVSINTNKGTGGDGSGGANGSSVKDRVFQQLGLEKVMRLEALRPRGEGSVSMSTLGLQNGEEDDDDDDPYISASPKKKDVHGGRSGGAMSQKLTQILRKGKTTLTAEKPFEVVIPVTNERMKPAEIKKTLKTEYATRYCEHLGVTPTSQNINFVLRTLPLDKCKIRQVLHPGLGRGERRNHISIQPHVGQPDLNKVKPAEFGAGVTLDVYGSGGGQYSGPVIEPVRLLGLAQDTSTRDIIHEREKQEAESGAKTAVHDVSLPGFEAYKKKHIYPYNLQERFEASEPVNEQQLKKDGGSAGNTISKMKIRDRSVPMPPSVGPSANHTPQPPTGTGTTTASAHPPLSTPGGVSSTAKKLNLHDQLLSRLGAGSSLPNYELPSSGMAVEGDTEGGVSAEQIAQMEHLLDQELDCDNNPAESPDIEMGVHSATRGGRKTNTGVRKEEKEKEDDTQFAERRAQLDSMTLRELDHTFAEFERDDVRSLQQQFLHDFPFDKYYSQEGQHGGPTGGSPLTYTTQSKTGGDGKSSERLRQEAEMGRVRSLLSADSVTDMLMQLFTFIFAGYVAPYTKEHTAAAQTSRKDALFVDFYRSLLDFYEANGKRGQLAVDIPIAICMFRVVVEGQMCNKWPIFFGPKSIVGGEVLGRITLFVSAIIDPTGLGSHLSRIESTPQALRALHKKRLPKQLSVTKMTPLMQFIVGDSAVSSEAKLLLRDRQRVLKKPAELREIESQLSPLIRPRLLDVVIMRKLLPTAEDRGVNSSLFGQ